MNKGLSLAYWDWIGEQGNLVAQDRKEGQNDTQEIQELLRFPVVFFNHIGIVLHARREGKENLSGQPIERRWDGCGLRGAGLCDKLPSQGVQIFRFFAPLFSKKSGKKKQKDFLRDD